MDIMTREEYIFYEDNNSIEKWDKLENTKIITNMFKINSENIKFELILEKSKNDQIILIINEYNKNVFIKYRIILSKNNLINFSPYFKLLNVLDQLFVVDTIYSLIKTKLDDNILKINKNSLFKNNKNNIINIINIKNSTIYISHLNEPDNKIYFIFDIIYCNLKKEEIKIKLEQIEKVEDKDYLNIIQILLNNKYIYLQQINFLRKNLRKAKKTTKKYEEFLDNCDSYFGQSMTTKMYFLDMGIDTDIFLLEDQYDFVVENLSRILKKNFLRLNQIYKASCNGDNINAFHQSCKDIPNTLILIITDEKRKFGGFTQAVWDKSNKYKYDNKAFLFSLDNYEIYPILDKYKNKAINCRENFYAPIFGEDLFLFDGFFSSQLNKTNEKYYNYSRSKVDGDYKLSGQEYFTVTEMEVYEVIFSK